MQVKENLLKNFRIKALSPPSGLKPYINSYYVYENLAEPFRNNFFRALPNGRVELFFLFHGSQIVFQDKKHKQRLSAFLAGIFELSYPMKIRIETNGKKFTAISIIFTHMGVNQLLGINLYELTNRVVETDQFTDINRQYETISKVEEEKHLFGHLNTFFLNQLNMNNNHTQSIIPILNHLEKMTGFLSVGRLAHEFQISYKSLYRLFVDEMGISPKMYLKIHRFNRACYLLDSGAKPNITEIVYECGYHDQPHFIHEFKSIMKESPRHYLRSDRGKFYFNRPYAL